MKTSKIIYSLTAVIFVVSLLAPVMAASDTQQTTSPKMELGKDYGTLVSVEELKGYYTIETYIENDPETLKLLVENGIMKTPDGSTPTEFSVTIIDEILVAPAIDTQSRGIIYMIKNVVYTGRTTDLRSLGDYYGGPGGIIYAPPSETLQNSWSASVGIAASTVSAGIGCNVTESKSIGVNPPLSNLKENERGCISVHAKYDNYEFDVYNTWFGKLFPIKLGSGTAKVFTGLEYRHSKWAI